MSRTFDDSLNADLSDVFFSTDEFASPVTIERGVTSTSNVAAIVAKRQYGMEGDGYPQEAVDSIDFDFVTSAYAFWGSASDPKAGDTITTSDGQKHEVMRMPGRECFERRSHGDVIRVHSVRIK